MDQPDPSQLRISDEDRHKVCEILRDAAGEGRIDLDELEERIEATYAAKVYADLIPITLDLPGSHLPAPVSGAAGPAGMGGRVTQASSIGVFSEVKRNGQWCLPATHKASAVMGSVKIDLREASFSAQESVITAHAVMGDVEIVVNAATRIILEGTAFMGDFKEGRHKVAPDQGPQSPVVRINGFAFMGSVKVTRKRMPGDVGVFKKMLGG